MVIPGFGHCNYYWNMLEKILQDPGVRFVAWIFVIENTMAMLEQSFLMRISCAHVHERERPTLNRCALSHWLPPATNHIDSTLLTCFVCTFYARSSVINAATFPVLIRLFTRLPLGSRRTSFNPCGFISKLQTALLCLKSCSCAFLLIGH